MASSKNSEKTKRILVATLFGAMIVVAVYQLWFSGPTPKPKLNKNIDMAPLASSGTSGSQSGANQPKPSAVAIKEAQMLEMLSDLSPLDLPGHSKSGENDKPGLRGSIFAQWVPPP